MTDKVRDIADTIDRLKHAELGCKDRYLAEVMHHGYKALEELQSTIDAQKREIERQWQPIKTAPYGEEVLIGRFVGEEFRFGRSMFFYLEGNPYTGEGASGWVWSTDDVSETIADDPTHWMPLPAPPINPPSNDL